MASRSFSEEDLSCPVCCDIFLNPVLLSCSHSFCSGCIQKVWENQIYKVCPVCRTSSLNDDPPLNLALRNLCESFRQESGRRSSSGVCSVHKEQLKLFCLDDQQPVCLVCRDSRKHAMHRFCPVDEAIADNKEILKASLEDLQEDLRISVDCQQNLCETAEDIKIVAQSTETQIQEAFKELHQFLHDEEAFRITALREEEKQKSQKMKEKIEETSRQISSLSSTITDIEEQMKSEDVSFLQNFKTTLQRVQNIRSDRVLSPSVTATFTDHLTNLKLNVLQKIQDNVGKTPDFSSDQVILEDSVKYNESGGGNGTDMLARYQSEEEPPQVKENKMKTWRVNASQRTVSPDSRRDSQRTVNQDWRSINRNARPTAHSDRRTFNRDSRPTVHSDRRTFNRDSLPTVNQNWQTVKRDSRLTVHSDSLETWLSLRKVKHED